MRIAAESLAADRKHLEACALLEKLATMSPGNPLIWNDLAVQYEAAGQKEKAFEALDRAYTLDRTYPPTLYNLGKFTLEKFTSTHTPDDDTVLSQRLLADVIYFLNANLDHDPGNVGSHYYLAVAYALRGDEERASAHTEVALRLAGASGSSLSGRPALPPAGMPVSLMGPLHERARAQKDKGPA